MACTSSGVPYYHKQGSQGSATEAYAGSNEEKKSIAGVSEQAEMILKNAEILCTIAWETRDEILEGLINKMHPAGFDLNVFRSAIHQGRICVKPSQCEREWMIDANK